MNPIKCVEFNKFLERCKKKTHLTFYDYHTIMVLASMKFSTYDIWQQNHDVTNTLVLEQEQEQEHEQEQEQEQDIAMTTPINTIADIISVSDQIKMLKTIKPELELLNSMIGMHKLKTNIVNQILYYVQKMHIGGNDYKHIVISGPPGTGKTEIAKLMGMIFSKLSASDNKLSASDNKLSASDNKLSASDNKLSATLVPIKEPVFIKATRADLIAGYVGQTAIKTRALIDKCIGGVLFIDEAYSFGDDTFSKECVDTLCEALSSHKDNLTVIIAGYEDQMNQQFFSLNPGLESRFSWRYNVDAYNAQELHDILMLKVKKQGWTMEPLVPWFEKHFEHFNGYGRDMETLLFKVKIAHSRRVFSSSNAIKKCINVDDMNAGFKVFAEHKKKSQLKDVQKSLSLMYT